jgi:hypothetical protein
MTGRLGLWRVSRAGITRLRRIRRQGRMCVLLPVIGRQQLPTRVMRSRHPRLRCIRPRPIPVVAAGVVILLGAVEAAVGVERTNKAA